MTTRLCSTNQEETLPPPHKIQGSNIYLFFVNLLLVQDIQENQNSVSLSPSYKEKMRKDEALAREYIKTKPKKNSGSSGKYK